MFLINTAADNFITAMIYYFAFEMKIVVIKYQCQTY